MNELKRKVVYIKANYKSYNIKEKMRILGSGFIKMHVNRCKIIYKNKLHGLKEYFEDIQINYNHNEIIKLKIVFFNYIIDMSYMFYDCHSLISFSIDKQKYLQLYIINMISTFQGC